MKRFLFLLTLAVAGGWIVRSFLFEAVSVASGSMQPSLPVGNHYLVNKMVYRFHPPQRGDIIVFKNPTNESKGLIKRVIAIGGDQVEIRAKDVFLNGSALPEPYAMHKRASERLVGDNLGPLTVPPGHVFVLGDNRDESEDSSVWKKPTGEHIFFIPNESIDGRLIRVP